MMKGKKFFFSFSYYDHYAMLKREKSIFFIYLRRSLRHDQERKIFFHLATIFTNEEGKMFFFI